MATITSLPRSSDDQITAPMDGHHFYAPLLVATNTNTNQTALPFFIESATPPPLPSSPSAIASSSSLTTSIPTGRFICTARARSQFGTLLSRVSMYEIVLPQRGAPASSSSCIISQSPVTAAAIATKSTSDDFVAWRTLLTLPNQPALSDDTINEDDKQHDRTMDAFAQYRASCPPLRVMASSSSSSSSASTSCSLSLCHRLTFRACYHRPHYDETLGDGETCTDLLALQYPARSLPNGIIVRNEKQAVQQRRQAEKDAATAAAAAAAATSSASTTSSIHGDSKRSGTTSHREHKTNRQQHKRPTMIRTPMFDRSPTSDDDDDNDDDDGEGDSDGDNDLEDSEPNSDHHSDTDTDDGSGSGSDDDDDRRIVGDMDDPNRVTLMMHINYATWHVTPLAATYSWQPVSHAPSCTIIGIHGPSGRWRLAQATRISALYTKLCAFDRINNQLVTWPDMQLIDTWTVRHGGPLSPDVWSDIHHGTSGSGSGGGHRPSDNPALLHVVQILVDHIGVRTLASLIVDYLAVARRMFLCRKPSGGLCLFEPSLEQFRDLPSSIPVSSIPHSSTGRVVASTCQRYMVHIKQVVPKRRQYGVTMQLTIVRFDQHTTAATTSSPSSSSSSSFSSPTGSSLSSSNGITTFVIGGIPVSPYDLRVWFRHDAATLYYSYISDAPRSTSWIDPSPLEDTNIINKRYERIREQCRHGLWQRRIIGIDLASWQIHSVHSVPLTDMERSVLCGAPVIITTNTAHSSAQSAQLGDPGHTYDMKDSYSSALHEHIYRSIHMALGRQSVPRMTGAVSITCSSPDQRRHLIVDRFDQLVHANQDHTSSTHNDTNNAHDALMASPPSSSSITSVPARVWMMDIAECCLWPVDVAADIDSDRMQWHRWYTPGADETGDK